MDNLSSPFYPTIEQRSRKSVVNWIAIGSLAALFFAVGGYYITQSQQTKTENTPLPSDQTALGITPFESNPTLAFYVSNTPTATKTPTPTPSSTPTPSPAPSSTGTPTPTFTPTPTVIPDLIITPTLTPTLTPTPTP